MEDNGVLRTLVDYFKNSNTSSISLLDVKAVLITMLNEWKQAKSTYSMESFKLKYLPYMIFDNIFQIHIFSKQFQNLNKNHSLRKKM